MKLSDNTKSFFSSTKGKVLVLGSLLASTQAMAADIAIPTFSSDQAVAVGGAVLLGLAAIWAIKRAMGMAK